MPAARLHGHALRKGRVSEPGYAYLLTTVTDRRRPVFGDWRIGRLLVAELRAEHEAGRVESLAWVVMPDHLHWLTILREGTLDALMRRVKSRSARAINSVLATAGSYGKRATTTMPCAPRKTCARWRVMWSPIPCARDWRAVSVITPCGMPPGCRSAG